MSHPNMSRNDKALRTSGIWTQHVLHFSFWYRNNLSIISFVWANHFFSKWFPKLELSDKGNIMPTIDRQAAYEEVLDELDDLTDNSDLDDE